MTNEDAWVIDAMKVSSLGYRVERTDAVVFLEPPRRAPLSLRWRGGALLGTTSRRDRRRSRARGAARRHVLAPARLALEVAARAHGRARGCSVRSRQSRRLG